MIKSHRLDNNYFLNDHFVHPIVPVVDTGKNSSILPSLILDEKPKNALVCNQNNSYPLVKITSTLDQSISKSFAESVTSKNKGDSDILM